MSNSHKRAYRKRAARNRARAAYLRAVKVRQEEARRADEEMQNALARAARTESTWGAAFRRAFSR